MCSLSTKYTGCCAGLESSVPLCIKHTLMMEWTAARLTESYNVCYSPLRKNGAPAVHSFPSLLPSLPSSIPPSLLQVLLAPLGSHPSLSHTGPIIGAAHKLVGLQMGRACWTYMVSAAWTKTTKQNKNVVIGVWMSRPHLYIC